MKAILITGSTGRLGKWLKKEFYEALTPAHSEMDITNRELVERYIGNHKPDTIIHLAAWVDVRGCEENKEKALKINVGGTESIVEAVIKHCPNCHFVYPSTACIFRGDRGDYTEEDIPYPINFYGLTKLISEYVVKRLNNYLIIRTDFVDRAKWRYEGAFVDRFSTCVFADTLARGIRKVIDENATGMLHLTGKRKISHFDLAKITTPDVKPIKLADAGLPLPRDQSLRSVRGGDFLELEY
jgi:dTDP-4-dehydrorhamnose reductase